MNNRQREEMLVEALGPSRFFKPRSARVYKAESVVVVNDNGSRAMLVKLKDGRLLSSASRFDSMWQWLRSNFWAASHHKALMMLGAITSEQLDALSNFAEKEAAENELKSAANDLRRGLEKSGLKPTKAQQKFIAQNKSR